MKTEAEVFGKRVPVVALIAVALLALQFGWRAAAGAGLFLFLYLVSTAVHTRHDSTARALQVCIRTLLVQLVP